jgi:hypothetical protein
LSISSAEEKTKETKKKKKIGIKEIKDKTGNI